jgi:hypothetical protein
MCQTVNTTSINVGYVMIMFTVLYFGLAIMLSDLILSFLVLVKGKKKLRQSNSKLNSSQLGCFSNKAKVPLILGLVIQMVCWHMTIWKTRFLT